MGRAVSKIALAIAVFLLSVSAHADEDKLSKEEQKKLVTNGANTFSDCAGIFRFMASINEKDKPATAQQFNNMANGSEMTVAYFLAGEYASKNKTPKPYGDFMQYAKGRAEVTKTRMMSLLEQKDLKQIKLELDACVELLPFQEEIIQKIRDSAYGR